MAIVPTAPGGATVAFGGDFDSFKLDDAAYFVPCHGVGQTGHAKKVLNGIMGKDTGVFSSNVNIIIRQAGKVPGPGTYQSHTAWTPKNSALFGKVDRNMKLKVGAGGESKIYEHKDVSTGTPLAGRDNLSHIKRVKFGAMSKSKKRSFLDRATAQAALLPGVGHYATKANLSNKLDTGVKGLTWVDKKSQSKGTPAIAPAPMQYKGEPDKLWLAVEKKPLSYTMPKSEARSPSPAKAKT